jgi:hypothetical protein
MQLGVRLLKKRPGPMVRSTTGNHEDLHPSLILGLAPGETERLSAPATPELKLVLVVVVNFLLFE